MITFEVNIEGLVGPTHHYAGLGMGNLASLKHAHQTSNPRKAALEVINKMRLLNKLGIKQIIYPPHIRPNLRLLHRLGFRGTVARQIEKAYQEAPHLLQACFSAAGMWTANAATVSASIDTKDHKVHFTPANLIANFHRHQETAFTTKILKKIFSDPKFFKVHKESPNALFTADEGAANHMRLCAKHNLSGLNVFIYGQDYNNCGITTPTKRFLPRQSLQAQKIIMRSHKLARENVFYIQQNPKAIDEGVFHNDVLAMSNENLLILHKESFTDQKNNLDKIKKRANFNLQIIEIPSSELTIANAVASYFFNSQLITLPLTNSSSTDMVLIAPQECQKNTQSAKLIEQLLNDPNISINKVLFVDITQSMQNGGGPACLRLRVPLTEKEYLTIPSNFLATAELLDELEIWVTNYYRDRVNLETMRDPNFTYEAYQSLEALSDVLKIHDIYSNI